MTDTLMTLSQAARTLPHRPAASTLWRWCRKGIRGIRLEYLRLGGRIFVEEEALRRFGLALAQAYDDDATQFQAPPVAPRGPGRRSEAEREKAAAAAVASLG